MSPLNITQPLGIWSIMATIRWCPIFPKWDIYQPLLNDGDHTQILVIKKSQTQGIQKTVPAWHHSAQGRRGTGCFTTFRAITRLCAVRTLAACTWPDFRTSGNATDGNGSITHPITLSSLPVLFWSFLIFFVCLIFVWFDPWCFYTIRSCHSTSSVGALKCGSIFTQLPAMNIVTPPHSSRRLFRWDIPGSLVLL